MKPPITTQRYLDPELKDVAQLSINATLKIADDKVYRAVRRNPVG